MIPGLNKRVFNFHDVMLYVALARRHLRLMILLVSACMLGGLATYIYSRPVYFSRALIHVSEMPLPLDSDTIYHDSGWNSLITTLRSPVMIERTARRLGIVSDYRSIESKYIRLLKFNASSDGSGIEVEIYSYEKSWPARWAQAMVEEFILAREENRVKFRNYITQSWGDVMKDANSKIDQSIDNAFNFADQSKLVNASIDMNSLRDVPLHLVQVKQRIDTLDGVLKRLDDPGLSVESKLSLIDSASAATGLHVGQVISRSITTSSDNADEVAAGATPASVPEAIIVPSQVSQPEWQRLDGEVHRLEAEIADASRFYLPGHRKMIVLSNELQAARKSLEIAYENAHNRLVLERESLVNQQQYLDSQLPKYAEVNHEFAKLQKDNQLRGAGQIAYQNLYVGIEKFMNELDYTADKERMKLEYMGLLYFRDDPVAPSKMTSLAMGLALGLVLAIAIPFLIEYLDFTLSNLEEVEATFQMRGLGIVPQLSSGAGGGPILLGGVGDETGDRNLVENFRVVRTNLLAMGTLSKAPHVTMITSSMPKEGKTVVSSNLAMSFAQTGTRTLLIDTDLRRGRLHRLFGLGRSPGLSDYLLGKVPLSEAIRFSGKENLWILSSGQHVESGTELLGSNKFSDLMTSLRLEYDRIVMDTPPVLGLSETSVLQNLVDGVLFVIWSSRTPIRNMKTAIDILSANGANFYGFILNRLDLSSTANYYQYYYYSSDYYHSYHSLENA